MAVLCSLALMATGCKQQETRETHPVKVKVISVAPVRTSGGQQFSGTVEESSSSTLSFPVSGTVTQIRVEAGQRVAKGQLIAALDEATLQNAYDATAATLEQAEDAYRRMKQLHDSGSLPEMDWVETQSKLKQAQAAERISKKNLADGKLYAPFAGVISEKNVEAGQNVMPGAPVVRLVTVGQVKVSISVPENEISHVAIGQPVSVCVAALGGRVFNGKIVEKGISANPLSRSYEVKAAIGNQSGALMPGMVCTLSMDAGKEASAIILPANVIQTDEANRTFVWIAEKGKARKRFVVAEGFVHDGVRVASGLAAGDDLIVEGQQKVSEGMDITSYK